MNVASKLEALGLKGWTIRESHITDDQTILDRIEWKGEKPLITWKQLQDALTSEEKEAIYSAWVANGFDTGLGFKMAVAKDDQTAMSNLMTGLKNKAPSNDSKWILKDINGVKVEVTYAEFKTLADSYFDYVYGAWRQS